MTRVGQATGETVLVPPRNRWSRVGHITGQTGKVADGETVVDGLVVAENRSNVRGAKEPCCTAIPVAVGEAGALCQEDAKSVMLYEKMRVGPSEPLCRGRLQTAISCYGLRAAVVNVMVKRRGI